MGNKWKKRKDEEDSFDTWGFEQFRRKLLRGMEPVIARDVVLKEHTYKCIEAGPVAVKSNVWFVLDEEYIITKDRATKDCVNVRGWLHNTNTKRTFQLKTSFCIPVENCKLYLKLIS